MPTNLCNAAQPSRRERVSALKLGAALAASLWFACEAGPVHAQAVTAASTAALLKPEVRNEAAGTRQPQVDWSLTTDSSHPDARKAQLSPDDVRRYREIFALQRRGAWDEADKLIAQTQDKRLLGHVFAGRLLHPERKAAYADLAAWMARYADHAPAERIHTLAERRKPAGGPPLRSPRMGPLLTVADGDLERLGGFRAAPDGLFARVAAKQDAAVPGARDGEKIDNAAGLYADTLTGAVRVAPRGRAAAAKPSDGDRNRARIDALLRQGDAKAAWDLLNTDDVAMSMDREAFDAARQRIADSFLLAGELADALAAASAGGSGKFAGQANWTAGLAAWRGKQYDRAARHFESALAARPSSPWTASAAAFWAGRAQLKAGQPDRARVNLAAAARFPHTFYGLLAGRTLGETPNLRWTAPALTPAHLAAAARSAAGARAVALLQVGEFEAAEGELRRVNPVQGAATVKPGQGGAAKQNPAVLREALLALAERGGMAELSMRLGNLVAAPDGAAYDGALYPLPHWKPRDGFHIDPALLFAVARQESRFDARLVTRTGASGLLQIMPGTAKFVRSRSDDIDDVGRDALLNPAENLEMGQRYLTELMQMPAVGNNMFYLAAAYNAGPGNLVRWRKQFREVKDPLLFMESLPFAETRDYLEKLMANYWIYRLRLGRDVSSLDDVAAGRWPLYTPVDDHPKVQPVAVSEDAED
jgi:soluble lytic murein transglycosylase